MPPHRSAKRRSSGGFRIGKVGRDLKVRVGRDWVGRDKIVNITKTTTIKISVETVTQKPLLTVSPYRGLDRFEDRDKDLFFGRDQLLKSLLAQINRTNIILVLGASGSGKSSVVRAGLLPRLSGELGARFRYFAMVPDVNPFLSLSSALQVGGFSQAQTRELPDAQPDAPTQIIRGLQREGEQWLIFVDQFEEIFRISDERLGTSFISALVKIAQHPTGSIKLVLAMRADFFDRLSPFPEFVKLIEKNIAYVTDMQVDELRLAIEQPAARHGVVFEQGLVEEIIKDVQGQAGSLPLLQYTLSLCWQEEECSDGLADRHLNTQTYRQLGGVRGALQKRADEIYASFGGGSDPKTESARQKVVRQIFLRVVDLAGGGSDETAWRPVRRRVPKATFSSAPEKELLQALIDQKLLVSSGRLGAESTVEVAHEALFTSWKRLKDWIAGGKQVIFARNRLADDAHRWHSLRQKRGTAADEELLPGSRLVQALEMRDRGDFDTIVGGLSQTETQFLDASAAFRDLREQEEQERKQRELAQAQALATEQKKRADDQEKAAAQQRKLTQDALAAKKKTSEVASRGNVSLARYSEQSGKNAQALAHLAQALRLNPENREASSLALAMLTEIRSHSGSIQHSGDVILARFSPDGQRVVTVSGYTAQLWDAASGQRLGEPIRHENSVNSAQFSPDSQRILTASWDNTAQVWDVTSGKPIGEPMRHKNYVGSAEFSPDGQRVVTVSIETARLWDAASGQPIGEPMTHIGQFRSAQFSPDGQRVVTASSDRTARLWDAASGQPLGEPMTHDGEVNSAQFSPDGKCIVTASWDNTARLWDAASGKPIGATMWHEDFVHSAQFSPDGQRVVTASTDMTARLWDAASGQPLGEPMRHKDRVKSAVFSPDGQWVVTVTWEKTAHLWDAASGQPLGYPLRHELRHEDCVNSAEFSPDGKWIVTASRDKTARVWDVANGELIAECWPYVGADSIQFNSDGQWIVTTSKAKTARVWDVASGKSIGEPMTHEGEVISAQFSHDGQRIVTASSDKTARLWDAASGKPIGATMWHEDVVHSAQFSPDGQRVVTASKDMTARLWDAASGQPLGEPMTHEWYVESAQFSPDGQRVVTVSGVTARLWDAASGKLIGRPMTHEDSVFSAQFSPDGQRIVTASSDKTARLWDAVSLKSIGEPMMHEDYVASAQFSPDGQHIVTSGDKTVRLWDVASRKPIAEPMTHEWYVKSPQFSPDGQRVVIVSEKTARLWDATSIQPLGGPIMHENLVESAQFSPDGQRIVTVSGYGAVRLWDVPTVTHDDITEDILSLAELAEATGGIALETAGNTENLKLLAPEQVRAPREKIAARFLRAASKLTPLQRFMKWSVSDRRSRTISPFSKVTISEWLENRIKWGTDSLNLDIVGDIKELRAAMEVDPANARVTAHLGRRLADYALKQDTDADEARRARGEADFLTSRALKLAPDSNEVKKLRDEVVKLLEPKIN